MKMRLTVIMLALFCVLAGFLKAAELPVKPTIAVAEFEGQGLSKTEMEGISEFIRTGFVNTGMVNVMDRQNMDAILEEQKFQMSGCTSNECAVKMGKLLNVQKIVNGNINKMGGEYYITANVIDVETGKIAISERISSPDLKQIAGKSDILAAILANRLLGKSKTLSGLPAQITGKDGAAMVLIPAGEFLMGSPEGEGSDDEHPRHKVYLDAYYIDKYEVTFDQYDKFCEATDRRKPSAEGWDRGNRPVINVSWEDANAYAKWAGKRLPTEAEWEKACRAGSTGKYCYGNSKSELLGDYAWYDNNSGSQTHPVGQKKPNAWGLYDMHGNVWEWCADWYDENYYSNSPNNNPIGANNGSDRVLRSGSWYFISDSCRSANRDRNFPANTNYNFGFRCALSAKTQ